MKILIAGHDLKFIQFFIEHLENSEHEIRLDEWENHVAHNIKNSYELLDWADIIFCEWGLGNSIFYSKNKRSHQRLIVRLHRQELETSYLSKANIANIDAFITVSPYIYEEFSRTFQLPRHKIHLIYNSVDLKKFRNLNLPERKFNIGMVGYLPKLKRMDIALDIFEQLYEEDNRYKLYFKGKRPEELGWLMRNDDEVEYFEEQFNRIEESEWKDNVIFEPFGDVVDFYNRMEIILSVSDVESFHLAVAEGMATGAVPIITNWEGSSTIYNKRFIIDSLEKIPNYLISINANREEFYMAMEKDIKKFDYEKIIEEINKVIVSNN